MSTNNPSTDPIPPAVAAPASTPSASVEGADLAARVAALEARYPTTSWVYGPNIFKRALAMWANVAAVQLVFALVIWGIVFGCGFLFFALATGFGFHR